MYYIGFICYFYVSASEDHHVSRNMPDVWMEKTDAQAGHSRNRVVSVGQHQTYPHKAGVSVGQHQTYPHKTGVNLGQDQIVPHKTGVSLGQDQTDAHKTGVTVAQDQTDPHTIDVKVAQDQTDPHNTDVKVAQDQTDPHNTGVTEEHDETDPAHTISVKVERDETDLLTIDVKVEQDETDPHNTGVKVEEGTDLQGCSPTDLACRRRRARGYRVNVIDTGAKRNPWPHGPAQTFLKVEPGLKYSCENLDSEMFIKAEILGPVCSAPSDIKRGPVEESDTSLTIMKCVKSEPIEVNPASQQNPVLHYLLSLRG